MGIEKQQKWLRQAEEICRSDAFRSFLWEHVAGRSGGEVPEALDLRIHPNDQMLLHSLRHHEDVYLAVSQYYNVALQQHFAMRQILGLFGFEAQTPILDFACGYGRLLRLLRVSLPDTPLVASEVQADALDFVRERFHVRAVPSDFDPARFQPGETFGFIWAASLFSHLPEVLFRAWLSRLWEYVDRQRGALCFSVHGASLVPGGLVMPENGILYLQGSEIGEFDSRHYGTSYVTESFVRDVVQSVIGEGAHCVRIAKGLAHEQDLYLVTAADLGAAVNPRGELTGFRRGPWGWVDERSVDAAHGIYLRGWAASLDDGPLPHVEIRINGHPERCPTGLEREDVARVLENPRLVSSGWEFRLDARGLAQPVRIEVSAESERGERALLYFGYLWVPDQQAIPVARVRGGLVGRLARWWASRSG